MSQKFIKGKAELLERLIAEIGKCEKCGSTERLTIDHIVPEDIMRQFGLTDYEMLDRSKIQLMCAKCNVFKGNRLDLSNPKTKEILIELLNA